MEFSAYAGYNNRTIEFIEEISIMMVFTIILPMYNYAGNLRNRIEILNVVGCEKEIFQIINGIKESLKIATYADMDRIKMLLFLYTMKDGLKYY